MMFFTEIKIKKLSNHICVWNSKEDPREKIEVIKIIEEHHDVFFEGRVKQALHPNRIGRYECALTGMLDMSKEPEFKGIRKCIVDIFKYEDNFIVNIIDAEGFLDA